jgi:hypothetical protein
MLLARAFADRTILGASTTGLAAVGDDAESADSVTYCHTGAMRHSAWNAPWPTILAE